MYNEKYNMRNQQGMVSPVDSVGNRSSFMPVDEAKFITGKDLADCRNQLFSLFGNDYTIVGQRPVLDKKWFGFRQKELLEVKYVAKARSVMSGEESFQKNRDEIIAKVGGGVTANIQLSALDKKIEENHRNIEEKIEKIYQATLAGEKPLSIQKIEELLHENEFTFSYINSITTRLRKELSVDEIEDFDLVQSTVVDWIGESINIVPNIPHKYPHVIVVVGPTGIGKTTTIAKMAGTLIKDAKEKNEPKPSIKMITTDHTRVGAEEQLRHYCDIMEIDLYKADSASDIKKIFDDYKDSLEVLFIDTPGYSPNDFENIGKMRKILDIPGLHPDVYLALAANAKSKDMVSIIQNYETFNFNSVIITKLDETTAIGNVVSVLSEKGKSISFVTDGQQVPKKIERANKIRFLINLSDFKVDRDHIEEKFSEDR